MRRGLWTVAVGIGMLATVCGAEIDLAKRDAFLQELRAVCDTYDTARLRALSEAKGATPQEIDTHMDGWEMQMPWWKTQGLKTQKAVLLPLDDPSIGTYAASLAKDGLTMNGHLYRLNLPVAGYARIFFSGNVEGSTTPVGLEPDGSLRLPMVVRVPDSAPSHPTRPQIDAFVARVDALCRQKDIEGLKYLGEWTGASSFAIDLEISTWERWFSHNEYLRTVFQEANDKELNPESLKAVLGDHEVNGRRYRPNLPVVGFVIARFKTFDGDTHGSGNLHPIGVALDGTIRFVSQVPAP